VHGFAGRVEHLTRRDALLAGAAAEAPTALVITAVSGTAGGRPASGRRPGTVRK
jgi:hypothetical protein